MVIYTSEFTGSAYAKCPVSGTLLYTPLYEDLTFDTCMDNWCEVEFDLFSQGSDVLVHLEWVRDHLRVAEEGLFADFA